MATVEPRCDGGTEPFAAVFPGVGVKLSGKELEFYRRNKSAMTPFMAEASDFCEVNLQAHLSEDTISKLPDETQQFFTYAFSAGAFGVLDHAIPLDPKAAAGYSFGIYAALFAAGSISFTDGLSILAKAYSLMSAASKDRDLGMGIVIGLERGDLLGLLEDHRHGSVALTNTNHDACFVFSGLRPELIDFLARAKSQDAFAADLLDVHVPYHHPVFLKDCAVALSNHLRTVSWTEARFPIVSSIDQRFLTRVDDLIELTWKNLASPINWRQVVSSLCQAGISSVFECGPGISLSQNSRFLPFDMKYTNVKKAIKCMGP